MFDKYCNEIEKLNNFEREEILNKKFELYSDDSMNIYYAPHNEIVNEKAEIFIVGITPGWTQTRLAYKTAHEGLIKKLDDKEIKRECKRNSRFAGSMRKNIIEMLDALKLNAYLHLSSCEELFQEKDSLLHTTSLIPYPVFINNKNYTGTHPSIINSTVLYSYVIKYFYEEVKILPNALYIPLGISVEEVLKQMVKENRLKEEQCLFGFPHPSGANGHRKKQFEENKEKLKEKIENFYKSR